MKVYKRKNKLFVKHQGIKHTFIVTTSVGNIFLEHEYYDKNKKYHFELYSVLDVNFPTGGKKINYNFERDIDFISLKEVVNFIYKFLSPYISARINDLFVKKFKKELVEDK